MKKSGVYKITIGNNLMYIGSAVDLYRRESQHRTTLVKGTHYNSRMKNAWNKYGVMSFEILEYCEASDAITLEQKYLDKVFGQKYCMNILPTAGSCMGRMVGDETRQKISAALTGRKLSSEQKKIRAEKIAISTGDNWVHPNKGKPLSDEQKQKIKETFENKIKNGWVSPKKGVALSHEYKAKLSLAHTGKKLSEEHKAKISAALTGKSRPRKEVTA
jgi:group I intron endonuclease